jgi:hypothetical protein
MSLNILTRRGFIPALVSQAVVTKVALRWPSLGWKPRRHPLFGALAGLGTVAPGVDLTEPADPAWADLIEELYPWPAIVVPRRLAA